MNPEYIWTMFQLLIRYALREKVDRAGRVIPNGGSEATPPAVSSSLI